MKNRISVTITTLSLFVALATTSAFAQTSENFTVDVPFDFTVGSKTFSAGEYDVKKMNESSTALMVRSSDGRQAMVFLTNPANAKGAENVGQLVFNKYGSRHFLSQMWMPGSETGNHVPQSKTERALRRELASTNTQPQQVALLAR